MITLNDFKKAKLKNVPIVKMSETEKTTNDKDQPIILTINDGSPFEKVLHVKNC